MRISDWSSDVCSSDLALLQRMSAILPLAQPGTAEEVADGILFFCAEGANLVTGATLILDSGAHLELAMSRAGAAASVVNHPPGCRPALRPMRPSPLCPRAQVCRRRR